MASRGIKRSYNELRRLLKSDQLFQQYVEKPRYQKNYRKVVSESSYEEVHADLAYMVPRYIKNVRYRYFYLFKDILSQRLYGFVTKNATGKEVSYLFTRLSL